MLVALRPACSLCRWSLAFACSRDVTPKPNPPANYQLQQSHGWLCRAIGQLNFNRAQIACYEGSMGACDSIWLNDRVLLDSWLHQYGRTCGGRADLRAIRRANLSCTEAFPGHQ